jgi:hypothetical protein
MLNTTINEIYYCFQSHFISKLIVRIFFPVHTKSVFLYSITAVIFLTMFHASAFSQSGPYFGQTPPGGVPVRFAPSKIPLGAWGITFSPDGYECFISLNVSNLSVLKTSKYTNGVWPDLTTAAFSGNYWDMESHIVPDGTRMYFGSKRPLNGVPTDTLHNWCVIKTDSTWSEPQPMEPPLRNIFMMYPSVANNGDMYFTAGDGATTCWISVSRFVDGHYLEPEPLSDSVNYLCWPAHPFIAPDGSYIIFDACTDNINHIYELFISYRKPDSNWTHAVKLPAPINPGGCPYVSRDGKYFFFWKTNCTMWVKADFIENMRPLYGDYFGQVHPDSTARKFGPLSLLSDGSWWWHGSPAFSPDLSEMFFVKYKLSNSRTEINYMYQIDGRWTVPQKATFANQNYIEYNPFFSPSGDTIYYYSQKPGGPLFYSVRQTGHSWSSSQPLNLPIPANLTAGLGPSITRNNNIYMDFWEGNALDIYLLQFENSQYLQPVKIGNNVNSDSLDYGTCIDPDEQYLIFSSRRSGSYGLTDLYISYRNNDGSWHPAENMGSAINTADGASYPALSPDGQYIFYSSWKSDDLGYNPYWIKTDYVLHPVGIADSRKTNRKLELYPNYPNPFNPSTNIHYTIPSYGKVSIKVYDILGREVSELVNEYKTAGKHSVAWNASGVASGIYIYRITINNISTSRKMLLLK